LTCIHLILRSIEQSALADCSMRLEDLILRSGPPSFETLAMLAPQNLWGGPRLEEPAPDLIRG
jgi:hypothetical protein